MRMTGSRAYARPTAVPKMPTGLVELMEGMTKEVLGRNPPNVYEYCADHMQKLLEIRDGPTGTRKLSLEQKISRAQQKIQQRALNRWQKYDKEIQLLYETGYKDESILKNISNKLPITRNMHLANVEEIEIAQCENDKGIAKKGDELSISKESLGSLNTDLNTVDTKNITIVLENGITQPPKDELVHVITERGEAPQGIKPLEIKENEGLVENPLIPESFDEKKENVEKTKITESKAIPVKTNKVLEMRSVVQEYQQDCKQNSLSDLDISVGENASDTVVPKINKNENETNDSVIKENNSIDNLTTNSTAIAHSLSENKNQNREENTNNLKGDSDTVTISKNDGNDFQSSINSAGNEVISTVTINNNPDRIQQDEAEISDKIFEVTDNVISTPNIESTVNQSSSQLYPSTNKTVTGIEQCSKTMENMEVGENIDKSSRLGCDMSKTFVEEPPGVLIENSVDAISNNNRDTNNMDLETAAITIQKVFRSFLFKSRASNDETGSLDEDIKEENGFSTPSLNKERRPLGITRMDTMLQTVNEEKSLSLSTDDSSTISSAATIIQAHIRGFLVRNKLNSNKTSNSILTSEDPITPSTESETNQNQNNNKTILNIHIVPDSIIPSLSRDESVVTSMDLSLDGSPPSSINLHPLGYDKSEPRKQLKREDAIQSISPPSNNSGKLSEDIDSAKEILINGVITECSSNNNHGHNIVIVPDVSVRDVPKESLENDPQDKSIADTKSDIRSKRNSLIKMSSDEMDVVTPYMQDENESATKSSNTPKLIHSGELHDVVLPTNVSRGSTSVVRGE